MLGFIFFYSRFRTERSEFRSMAGGGFPIGHVLLEPSVGLLLDGGGLAVGQAGGQDGREVLALFVAASAGEQSPEVGLIQIFGDTATAPVKDPSLAWAGRLPWSAALRNQRNCLFLVACDFVLSVSLKIAKAESVFGCGIALFGHLAKLLEGCGFDSGAAEIAGQLL